MGFVTFGMTCGDLLQTFEDAAGRYCASFFVCSSPAPHALSASGMFYLVM